MLTVFYNCYCKNDWKNILSEHFRILSEKSIHIHAQGGPQDLAYISACAQEQNILLTFIKSARKYEHGAMEALKKYSDLHPLDLVLYLHTKGAGNPNRMNDRLRHYMNAKLLVELKSNISLLKESTSDALGVIYTIDQNQEYNFPISKKVTYFAGNFWLAKCSYIQSLLPYKKFLLFHPTRYAAEMYIGSNSPEVIMLDSSHPLNVKEETIPFLIKLGA